MTSRNRISSWRRARIQGRSEADFPTYDVIKNNNSTPAVPVSERSANIGNGDQAYNYASPFQLSYGTGDPRVNTSNKQIGAYLQDDWSPVQRLTLNLGVRWDYETNMLNTNHVTDMAAPIRSPSTGSAWYIRSIWIAT